ncbi:hypothetical protein QLT00_gp04 [Gordonia phage Commandaria]|uniref:Uncharacterized protein n=1 Tax=Gordonia phage Commandaria TaxID=3038364 RepID=A0AAF0GIE3_9CAUD|nr:hypothetical protein QLT00_gp04 [Gordonia phage Commandaria]WGH20787.1 hypothetical protein [Gordonia phage Commandaria]
MTPTPPTPEPDEPGTGMHELLDRYLFGENPTPEARARGLRNRSYAEGQLEELRKRSRIRELPTYLDAVHDRLKVAPLPVNPVFMPDWIEPLGFTADPVSDPPPSVFPRPLKPIQISYPRQTGKTTLQEIVDTAVHRANGEISAEKIREHLAPALRDFFDAIKRSSIQINEVMRQVVEENPDLFSDKPVHPKDVRDERGIKKPSTTPPMWAQTPNKRRRK